MTSSDTTVLIDDFHLSAGGVLMDEKKKQVCLIKKASSSEHLLPKGTKESEENLAVTAEREIYEETGYENSVFPDRLLGIFFRPDVSATPRKQKVIFWYYAKLKSSVYHRDTQEEYENFSNVWCTLEEAMQKLSFDNDKVLVQRAFDYIRLNEISKEISDTPPAIEWCGPENKCIRLLTPTSMRLQKGFVVTDESGQYLLVSDRVSHSWILPSDNTPVLGEILNSEFKDNVAPFLYQLHLDSAEFMVKQWYFMKLKLDAIANSQFVSKEDVLTKLKDNQDAVHIIKTAFKTYDNVN